MDSEYGFIGEIKHEDDGTMFLQTHAITNIAWNQATKQFYEENAESGLKFYNLDSLFGHVMVHKEPVISNVPKTDSRATGIPEGHPPLNHFLGIPFFEPGSGRKMNGMVGIANKPGGYSKEDVEFLDPFLVTCSNLIQAYAALQENVHLIDTLEEKVRERTFDLEFANAQLASANERVMNAMAAQLKNFACMSHEIRTPLNCIVGLSSLLLGSDLTPQQNDSMRMIVTSGELLSAIVNDVLDYSKLISGNVEIEIQATDLQATLDAVVHSIEVKAKDRNLTLKADYDPLVPKIIDTDGRRLQQILYNLLGNAIKFSKDHGEVEFGISIIEDFEFDPVQSQEEKEQVEPETSVDESADTASAPFENTSSADSPKCPFHKSSSSLGSSSDHSSADAEKKQAEASKCPFHKAEGDSLTQSEENKDTTASTPPGDKTDLVQSPDARQKRRYLRFIVKDYGKGIDPRHFHKIFQPFMQASVETEKIYGGTGLGLAITSKLVEGLSGRISVDSVLSEFSTFTVDIPFDRAPVDVDAMAALLRDKRIMLVKNDNTHELLSQSLVRTYKLNVAEFESCAELRTLAEIRGGIDTSRKYMCLVHEDLYEKSDLAVFAEAAPGTTVLTFGPKYNVKDPISRGHYRSLEHLLPSSFIGSLIQSYNEAIADLKSSSNNISSGDATVDYSGLRVLVAEDNLINQKVLRNMMKRVGVKELTMVDDGKKAVDLSAENEYDLILMDMQMPVMGEVEATRLITKREPVPGKVPPKVVFVTANAMSSFEQEARDAGAHGYIAKPFNLKKIEHFLANFNSGKDFIVAS